MARVLLCCMPFGSHHSPHLAVGLLKAVLERGAIGCDVRYFSLDFARRIGDVAYWFLAGAPLSYGIMAGEWAFTPALCGPGSTDAEAYLRWAQTQAPGFLAALDPRRLLEVQAEAEPFLLQCLQDVTWADYDLVGFSSSLQQNNASLSLARRIKQRWPNLPIVFGGANAQGEMGVELLRTFDFLDYACLGEGEAVLPELVRRITSERPAGDIAGLALRRDGRVHVARERATPVDLDSLPYPDYDDFFAQHQALFGRGDWHGSLPAETSRGCWWGERRRCTFCGASPPGTRYRHKSPARAVAELAYLGERYEPLVLSAADDIAPREAGAFLAGLAGRRPRLSLFYMVRPTIAKGVLGKMRQAGVDELQIGIESLSSPVLRLMRKGVTALLGIQALKWCRELGITVHWNLLYGVPREDPAEYARMAGLVPSLTHLRPPNATSALSLVRFSPHFCEPARYGLANVRPAAAYRHIHPGVSEAALWNLAGRFEFDYADGRDPQIYARPLLQAAAGWQAAYPESVLAYVDDGRRLRLFDTRPVARHEVQALEGMGRALYLACDRQQSLKRLRSHFQESEGDLQEILDRLVDERLVASEGRAYLSLAVDVGRHVQAEARAGLSDAFCLALARTLMHPRSAGAAAPEGA